jgi:pimeloyl-ACP methyl ester carboxylesterase
MRKIVNYLTTALVLLILVPACQSKQQLGSIEDFNNEEVSIEQKDENFTLAGTLSLPKGKGPYPAVLMLTGSGGHTRDQIISGLPMFKEIGDYLAANGIAVLRVDDRGEGASTGPKVRESTTEQRASDAMAAFNYLKSREEIDANKTGLLGHSEGTYTAALVAEKTSDVAFVIMLSPFAITGSELWVWQQGNILRQEGEFSEEKIKSIEKYLLNMVEHIGKEGNTDEGFFKHAAAVCLAWGDPPNDITNEFVTDAFGDLRQPWYEHFFSMNPQENLKNINQPILAIFGSEDQQTPPVLNVEPLSNSLLLAGNNSFTIKVLPNEDHFFMTGDGLLPNEHKHNEMEISNQLLITLNCWINQHLSH